MESVVFWKNFGGQLTIIENAITHVIEACDQIFENQNLKALLGVILSVGNFLNIGTPRGNARAIDIKSLVYGLFQFRLFLLFILFWHFYLVFFFILLSSLGRFMT